MSEASNTNPYLQLIPDVSDVQAEVKLNDLSSVETQDGNNLIHLLCKDRLSDAKTIKGNVSPTQRGIIKELLISYSRTPKSDILMQLLKHGCQPHKLNNNGETPFAIHWKKCQESMPQRLSKTKVIQIGTKNKEILSALCRAGAGPSKVVTREMVDVTVTIVCHNKTATKQSMPDPEQILQWTPIEAVLGQENNCDVQVELFQHLLPYLDNDQVDPILIILILKSAAMMLHFRVAEYGALIEFLLAMHRLFSRKPLFHGEFLRLRLVQELLPIVAALMGNNQCGAVNEQDEDTGFSPLHIAAGWGLDKVVKELLDHPLINVNITSRLVPNPLMHVLFHVKKNKMWQTDLMGPYVAIIKMLTEDDRLSVAQKDRNGATALSLCIKVVGDMGCRYREKHIYYTLHQHKTRNVLITLEEEQSISLLCVKDGLDKELVSLMQDHPDLDLEWADENGMTVLHTAAKMAMYTTIKSLIKKKPGLCNIPDKHGNTPLFYLVTHLDPRHTLEMIQQHTPLWDFEHTNNMGERAVEYYHNRAGKVFNKQINVVLKRNTDTPVPETLKRQRDLQRSQMTITPKLAKKGTDDKTSLQIEVEGFVQQLFAFEDIFNRLAEIKGEMVNSLDNGKSPLHYCAELGLLEELGYLLEHNSDVDVNLQSRNGYTALHLAALAGQINCVLLLLRNKGTKINIQDSDGNTVLFYVVVKFPPSDAISLVPTHSWEFMAENHGRQTTYDYYKKQVHEVDPRLEDQLRRRCTREPISEPVTPNLSTPKTPPQDPWPDEMIIKPVLAIPLGSAPNAAPPPAYASLEHTPPPENTRPASEIKDTVWAIVQEDRQFILSNFVDSDVFFNYLIQEKLMDSEFFNTRFRRTQKTDREVACELLEYLPEKGESTFPVFLRALEVSNQQNMFRRLRKLTMVMFSEVEVSNPKTAKEFAASADHSNDKTPYRKTWAP